MGAKSFLVNLKFGFAMAGNWEHEGTSDITKANPW
jgi:hypothetical protein